MTDFLLIDDDLAFVHVLSRALQRRGFAVACAHDAPGALAALASCPQARVVLDLNLGGASGLRLLPSLLACAPQARIVVLTGYASIATAVEAIKLGAIQYLAKPADVVDIVQAFERNQPDPAIPIAQQPMSLKRVSWEHLQRVLAAHDGNISETARALNMHRRTVQRMLAKRPVSQ